MNNNYTIPHYYNGGGYVNNTSPLNLYIMEVILHDC